MLSIIAVGDRVWVGQVRGCGPRMRVVLGERVVTEVRRVPKGEQRVFLDPASDSPFAPVFLFLTKGEAVASVLKVLRELNTITANLVVEVITAHGG